MHIKVAQSGLLGVNETDRLAKTDLGVQSIVRGCNLVWGVALWRVIVEVIPVQKVLDARW